MTGDRAGHYRQRRRPWVNDATWPILIPSFFGVYVRCSLYEKWFQERLLPAKEIRLNSYEMHSPFRDIARIDKPFTIICQTTVPDRISRDNGRNVPTSQTEQPCLTVVIFYFSFRTMIILKTFSWNTHSPRSKSTLLRDKYVASTRYVRLHEEFKEKDRGTKTETKKRQKGEMRTFSFDLRYSYLSEYLLYTAYFVSFFFFFHFLQQHDT